MEPVDLLTNYVSIVQNTVGQAILGLDPTIIENNWNTFVLFANNQYIWVMEEKKKQTIILSVIAVATVVAAITLLYTLYLIYPLIPVFD